MGGPEEGLAAALDQVRGVDIDEAAVRAHVMWPDHLRGAASDRGREGVPVRHFVWPPGPALYRFDATGFIRALEEQLTGNVAGYSIELTENGSTSRWPTTTGRRSCRTAAKSGRLTPGCTLRA